MLNLDLECLERAGELTLSEEKHRQVRPSVESDDSESEEEDELEPGQDKDEDEEDRRREKKALSIIKSQSKAPAEQIQTRRNSNEDLTERLTHSLLLSESSSFKTKPKIEELN